MQDYEEGTTKENFELVHSLIMCDRRSLCDIARQIGISFGAVHSILTDILGMSKVSARWVLKLLTIDQKKSKLVFLSISCLSMMMFHEGVYMCPVVNQDETLVHHFDLQAKKQIMQWMHPGSLPPKNLREFLQQRRWWPLSFRIVSVSSWWIILRKVAQ